MQEVPPGFKAGFIAVIGRPNVGKSTLVNAFLKRSLSIVSPLPQTTRHKILGILQRKDCQACFMDTPGLLDEAKDRLQSSLIFTTQRAAREDADVLLVLVEAPADPATVERLSKLLPREKPIVLAVNKADQFSQPKALADAAAAYEAALSPASVHIISALKGRGVDALLADLIAKLPACPPYYDREQLSDRWERFFASEIIRAGIFEQYHQEIPHACAVEIEEFKERAGKKDLIRATIYVERPNQKGILLGKGGRALRELHEGRVEALKEFLGRGVELELWVKVRTNWRKDPASVKLFGYQA